jgi:hypothetical protein
MTDTNDISSSDYHQIVRDVREAVRSTIPADATVLVISRGDDELLDLGDGRRAWHFPRLQDGKYSGYHPKDSAAALAHLDEWRMRGAQYLVLPATGFWWLEYYGDFASNLRRGHGVVYQDDSCIIFRLGSEGQASAALGATDRVVPHLKELVNRLLPDDARVAVVSSGDSRLVQLGGRNAMHFPATLTDPETDGSSDGGPEIAELDRLREEGLEYLVIPDVSPSWLDLHPQFVGEVDRRYRCIARRRNVCVVFSLQEIKASESEAEDESDNPRREGLWSRITRWLGFNRDNSNQAAERTT